MSIRLLPVLCAAAEKTVVMNMNLLKKIRLLATTISPASQRIGV